MKSTKFVTNGNKIINYKIKQRIILIRNQNPRLTQIKDHIKKTINNYKKKDDIHKVDVEQEKNNSQVKDFEF